MDLISVIIPVYNYANYIEETLRSVADQLHLDLECLIIDDGSTDGTREKVELFCKRDNRFRYYYQDNQGLASARNAGMIRAKGDYISFLDADDLWSQEKLSNQLRIFREFDCQIVYSDCNSFSEGVADQYEAFRMKDQYSVEDFIDSDIIRGSSSSVTIRRDVYERVGLFDINLRSLEDNDYWFRCALNGFVFRFCDSVDVKIRTHNGSMSSNQLKMYQYHLIVLEKQFILLNESGLLVRRSTLLKPLLRRLGRIRWYSNYLKRYDLSMGIHLLGFSKVGVAYFNALNLINCIKDVVHLLVRRREIDL